MKRTVDLIVHAKAVLPIAQRSVLNCYSVVVDSGKILSVLSHAEAEALYYGLETLDYRESHVILPGFINSHTHVGMTLLRGFADDLPLKEWLNEHIWPAEAKFLGKDFVTLGTELALAEMIRSGTTCFNDMYFYNEYSAEVIVQSRMRGYLGLVTLEFPSSYATDFDDYWSKAIAIHEEWKGKGRLGFCVAPHAPYTVSESHLLQMHKYAQDHGLRFHIHLHETAAECRDSLFGEGPMRHISESLSTPVQNFSRIGILDENLIAVHMCNLTANEIDAIGNAHASVVTCPASNCKLASGVCPVSDLISAGANVSLGTDGVASNNSLDMFTEMRLASYIGKVNTMNPVTLSASQMLEIATVNGARSLGISDIVGTLEVGKEADFIAIALDSIELSPCYDLPSHIVYACGREHVTDVWVGGERLLNDRKLTTIDERELLDKVRTWSKKHHG